MSCESQRGGLKKTSHNSQLVMCEHTGAAPQVFCVSGSHTSLLTPELQKTEQLRINSGYPASQLRSPNIKNV